MKIAVIGAGAIGNLVAAYLKSSGEDVSLVGNTDSVKAIRGNGLSISGVRGNFKIYIDIAPRLSYQPDLVILSTKIQGVSTAVKDNLEFIRNTTILTTQNGVRADGIVAEYIPKEQIVPSIVMFGATELNPGEVVHNFEGSWVIGKDTVIKDILAKVFPIIVSEDISGMKYLKIFVNANNCIPAILGKSIQESFSDTEISKISVSIWKEGRDIVSKAGIKLVSLPDFPLERLTKLTALPLEEAAKIFSGIMQGLSREPLYGSILQSIKRDRPSEIDYINGEFVALAKRHNLKAPLNERLVEMVHTVEATKSFFSKEELLNNVRTCIGN